MLAGLFPRDAESLRSLAGEPLDGLKYRREP
jgi:hypothetical protein